MSDCNDYWCELYTENNGKCDVCVKKDVDEDKPDLRVILKRRAVEQMKLDENKKDRGQKR